ncbi:hypothetical protein TorRG33x02_223840 [Trema orientale]|uniref:Uncharacterized protein n=1 Tax=Trema orientale TaxID=63057 RepID=A0A2P5E8J5_TREOI|nr:hypothetical protein TorRG33x02_223840 [Trema orientale]
MSHTKTAIITDMPAPQMRKKALDKWRMMRATMIKMTRAITVTAAMMLAFLSSIQATHSCLIDVKKERIENSVSRSAKS